MEKRKVWDEIRGGVLSRLYVYLAIDAFYKPLQASRKPFCFFVVNWQVPYLHDIGPRAHSPPSRRFYAALSQCDVGQVESCGFFCYQVATVLIDNNREQAGGDLKRSRKISRVFHLNPYGYALNRSHNLEVGGSNPPPATIDIMGYSKCCAFFLVPRHEDH